VNKIAPDHNLGMMISLDCSELYPLPTKKAKTLPPFELGKKKPAKNKFSKIFSLAFEAFGISWSPDRAATLNIRLYFAPTPIHA